MSMIATYMDDEIRERVHSEMLHGKIEEDDNEAFLKRYLEFDSEFAMLLKNEFGIDLLTLGEEIIKM